MLVTYELGTLKLIYLPGFITNAELSVVLMPNAFTLPGFRESLSLHCEIVRDMPPPPTLRERAMQAGGSGYACHDTFPTNYRLYRFMCVYIANTV